MTLQQYTVAEKDVDVRLDKLLTEINHTYSRQQVQDWIKEKHVSVNNKNKKANYRCKLNDTIKWNVPSKTPIEILPEKMELAILYEDDYLLVVNKPKGILVHPTETETTGTLVNGLKYHTSHLSDMSGALRPGIIHRLDRDTSGLLVVAKNNDIHAHLQQQFKNQTVERIYEAVVFGELAHNKGVIKAPIGRNPNNRIERAVISDGKYAETHFFVLQNFDNFTYVQCELKTGRTHQIRVHMKYIGHPIIGDEMYSDKNSSHIDGQALFAKQLSFTHPHTDEWMTFTIEQPTHIKKVLRNIAKMS